MSSAKITIIRASRWSQTLDRNALASGEPAWGIEPRPTHDERVRWSVSDPFVALEQHRRQPANRDHVPRGH